MRQHEWYDPKRVKVNYETIRKNLIREFANFIVHCSHKQKENIKLDDYTVCVDSTFPQVYGNKSGTFILSAMEEIRRRPYTNFTISKICNRLHQNVE